ncbi:4'-phosphopantetheinyl transferase family protein [Streptomyces virginiae]|uniref:4'-phosphopantetheinyl transferase family protein n=1 Tax=Streptomyces virginiae TaxID=1961 RepID=UPI0036CF650F
MTGESAVRPRFPPLAPGRVHRWGGAALLVARRSGPYRPPPLSGAELRVLEALPAWRRAEWTRGRLLAKRLVGDALAVPPGEVEVLPRDDGSPRVVVGGVPMPAVHVSISHTARHVAAALAPDPVGVDLCEAASEAAVRRVADHVLSPGELSLVVAGGAEAVVAAWALKEAAVKADRSSVFGAAPRGVVLLGLRPPVLGGRRRAMVWRADETVLALVLAHRQAGRPSRQTCVGAPCPGG